MKTTFINCCESVSNNRLEKPGIPIIPPPSKVIKLISSICEIPFTPLLFFGCLQIKVPALSESKVFLILIGISFLKAGCMVGGYSTFAPKWDNSIASS